MATDFGAADVQEGIRELEFIQINLAEVFSRADDDATKVIMLNDIERQIGDPPEDSLGNLRLGAMLVCAERNNEALQYVRAALDISSKDNAIDLQCASHIALGQVLVKLDRKSEACGEFRAAAGLQVPNLSDGAKRLLAEYETD